MAKLSKPKIRIDRRVKQNAKDIIKSATAGMYDFVFSDKISSLIGKCSAKEYKDAKPLF